MAQQLITLKKIHNSYLIYFQLSFDVGDEILVLQKSNTDWWWAELNGCCGYIPANHVVSQLDSVAQSILWQDTEYYDSYGKLVSDDYISLYLYILYYFS